MFSENEIATIIEIPEVLEATIALKKEFIEKEANLLEISEHDFLSLIMMAPPLGMALANGTISLFEELALNKMARKMSKGGFFLKVDPVAYAMKYLIKSFDAWEGKFHEVIILCMEKTFDVEELKKHEDDQKNFTRVLMNVPYVFVRFLSSFFLQEDSDVVEERSISEIEYKKLLDIGEKLGLDQFPVYKSFCKTFEVR